MTEFLEDSSLYRLVQFARLSDSLKSLLTKITEAMQTILITTKSGYMILSLVLVFVVSFVFIWICAGTLKAKTQRTFYPQNLKILPYLI